MSIACPRSHHWLQRTIQAWLKPSCRSVSTTSAINRGLRATQDAAGNGNTRGRDRTVSKVRKQYSKSEISSIEPERQARGKHTAEKGEHGATGGLCQVIKRLRDLLTTIQVSDSGPKGMGSSETVEEVEQLLGRVNAMAVDEPLYLKTSRLFMMKRTLLKRGHLVEEPPPDGSTTVIWLRPDDMFQLVTKGGQVTQPDSDEMPHLDVDPMEGQKGKVTREVDSQSDQNPQSEPVAETQTLDRTIHRTGTLVKMIQTRESGSEQIQSRLNYVTDELGDLLASVNEAMQSGKEQARSVRAAMDQQCGPLGEVWVTEQPLENERSLLWLKPDTQEVELVLSPQAASLVSRNREGHLADEQALNTAMTRMRVLVETVQNAGAGGVEKSLLTELYGLIDRVNEGSSSAHRWSQRGVWRALQRHLGPKGKFWVSNVGAGKRCVVHLLRGPLGLLKLALGSELEQLASKAGDKKPVEKPKLRQVEKHAEEPRVRQGEDDIPISVPYTTAASTFLYGSNTVLAALRAKRRKLYQLYLHDRLSARESNDRAIRKLAEEAGVPVHHNAGLKLLDKMSEERPHNGVVLEASQLPAPPVLGLGEFDSSNAVIPLDLDRQSAEDLAVNGAPIAISSPAKTWRYPFVVMLDGIIDPGNLGNILRTCHFYGVDAVAVASNTCANLNSSTLAKASCGACEAVRVLALPKPSNFVYECAKKGWRIFAAVAPPSPGSPLPSRDRSQHLTTHTLSSDSPLSKFPCILMLGAEGEGLRDNLQNRADFFVSIPGGARGSDVPDVGVDSVNVGVAAGVLVESFLRQPEPAKVKRTYGPPGPSLPRRVPGKGPALYHLPPDQPNSPTARETETAFDFLGF